MSPFIKVVIIQTSTVLHEDLLKVFSASGLVFGKDFFLTESPKVAVKFLEPHQEQLLITGTFRGDMDATEAFVSWVQVNNPFVLTALFTSFGEVRIPTCFDLQITRGSGKDHFSPLVEAIRKFSAKTLLSGKGT